MFNFIFYTLISGFIAFMIFAAPSAWEKEKAFDAARASEYQLYLEKQEVRNNY